MGGHHKKNLRAEKAKVKLKGAKLPKGLNVTKTEFKVRKIELRTQLKEHNFIDGQRQVNIKETLTRLKHHSATFRLEALRGLRNAIATDHVGIRGHFADLVQGVAAICLDSDKTARRECFKTLSCLLAAVSNETVSPFFHIISSYLRCAMTHIQSAVQDDALLMLDVLLKRVPLLVAAQSAKILQNFLEMISRLRAEGERAERTLTLHLGHQQTTIKWRVKVLLRLQHMLQTFAEFKSNGRANADSVQTFTFNARAPQYFSLKRCIVGSQSCDLSGILNRTVGDICKRTNLTDETKLLRGYVEHLMPLLLEAWLEVRPQTASINTNQAILSADAAQTLQIILDIIEQLWELIEVQEKETQQNELRVWFQQQYATQFVANFLQTAAYPFQQNEKVSQMNTKKRKKSMSTEDALDQYCLQQNVCVAFLLCRFYGTAQMSTTPPPPPFEIPLDFLISLLSNAAKLNELVNQRDLVLALRAYLMSNAPYLLQLDEFASKVRMLLRMTMQAFRNNDFNHEDGVDSKVLALLCEIAQTHNLVTTYGASEFEGFLERLPQLMLKPTISSTALVAMSNLGKHKNITFLKVLLHYAPAIIKNLQNIQVQGANNALESKRHIMNLFYWMNISNGGAKEANQQELVQIVERHVADKRLVSYMKFILT